MTGIGGAPLIWLRAAEIDDLALLIDLEAAAFGPASWGAEGVRTALIDSGNASLVAGVEGERAAGFAFWRAAAGEAEILSIGVAPGVRRQGMARALLMRLCDDARAEGGEAVFLEVDAGNEAAAALYEKLGFETVGARRAYYRNGADALIMRRNLNTPR